MKDKIKSLRKMGLRPRDIAERLGCTVDDVYSVIRVTPVKELTFPNEPTRSPHYTSSISRQIRWHENRIRTLRIALEDADHAS